MREIFHLTLGIVCTFYTNPTSKIAKCVSLWIGLQLNSVPRHIFGGVCWFFKRFVERFEEIVSSGLMHSFLQMN